MSSTLGQNFYTPFCASRPPGDGGDDGNGRKPPDGGRTLPKGHYLETLRPIWQLLFRLARFPSVSEWRKLCLRCGMDEHSFHRCTRMCWICGSPTAHRGQACPASAASRAFYRSFAPDRSYELSRRQAIELAVQRERRAQESLNAQQRARLIYERNTALEETARLRAQVETLQRELASLRMSSADGTTTAIGSDKPGSTEQEGSGEGRVQSSTRQLSSTAKGRKILKLRQKTRDRRRMQRELTRLAAASTLTSGEGENRIVAGEESAAPAQAAAPSLPHALLPPPAPPTLGPGPAETSYGAPQWNRDLFLRFLQREPVQSFGWDASVANRARNWQDLGLAPHDLRATMQRYARRQAEMRTTTATRVEGAQNVATALGLTNVTAGADDEEEEPAEETSPQAEMTREETPEDSDAAESPTQPEMPLPDSQ